MLRRVNSSGKACQVKHMSSTWIVATSISSKPRWDTEEEGFYKFLHALHHHITLYAVIQQCFGYCNKSQTVAELLGCDVYYALELASLITWHAHPLLANVDCCSNAEQLVMTAAFCDSALTRNCYSTLHVVTRQCTGAHYGRRQCHGVG